MFLNRVIAKNYTGHPCLSLQFFKKRNVYNTCWNVQCFRIRSVSQHMVSRSN